MRLKKVEICGFKSFKERTCLSFDSPITAIVGPNGCGKSNIVDAIRWAMGEPSAKALRGEEMEDIIFHGTDGTDPVGMAEVTLTFERTNGKGPPHIPGSSEIEVTRRLFRSGESEYSINRVPCRRKDIWDLFMNTGLGSRSYSIVEQERISRIISSKPEERRVIVEEVAGISRYKSRREAAQRKIEATSQNLLRLRDIRKEVEDQLRSLERQAKRAIHYKQLREELLKLERTMALRRWAVLKRERENAEEKLSELEDKVRDLLSRIQEEEGALEREGKKSMALEAQLGKMGRLLHELESQKTNLEARIQKESTELKILEETREALGREIEELEKRLEEVKERFSQTLEKKKVLSSELISRRAGFSHLKDLEKKEIERERVLKAKVEQLRVELVEKLSERAKLRNSISGHSKRVEELERERVRLEEEGRELASSIAKLTERMGFLEKEMAQQETIFGNLENCKESLEKKILERKTQLRELEDQLRREEDSEREIRSRLDALERLQRDLEGFPEGVRAIRDASSKGEISFGTNPPKVVAEVIHLAQGLGRKVANILGEKLQWIVLDGWDEVWRALHFIEEKGLGRVGFVLKEWCAREKGKGDSSLENHITFFQWERGYEELERKLLGNVEEVEGIEEARRRICEGCSSVLLTPKAEVIDPRGLVEGGERKAPFLAYVERSREIANLMEKTKDISERVQDLREKKEALESEVSDLLSQKEDLSQEARKAEIKLAELRKELQAAKEGMASLMRMKEAFTWRIEEHEREAQRITEAKEESSRILEKIEADIGSLEEELGEAKKLLEDAEKAKEEIRLRLTKAEVQVASWEETLRSMEREQRDGEKRINELQKELLSKIEIRETKSRRMNQLALSIEEAQGKLYKILPKCTELRGKLVQMRGDAERLRSHLRDREKELQDKRKNLRVEEAQLQQTKLRHKEILLRMEHLLGELVGRLELREEEIHRASNEPLEGDCQNEEIRIQALRDQLQRFHDVNLAAVEQYEELKKRYDELASQQEDLEKSIQALRRAIHRIDRTSRRRFKEAFERLDSEFRRVFPILFEGGEARLELTEAEDILECGLEIVARPPGKRLQKISLLSGGEKALTAVALIFAMVMVKETPFCLLDEVDAPLDDANIVRFTRMLKELSRRSQFIIVTHSKKTMEMADTLYGVTMETPGISKTISVRLN